MEDRSDLSMRLFEDDEMCFHMFVYYSCMNNIFRSLIAKDEYFVSLYLLHFYYNSIHLNKYLLLSLWMPGTQNSFTLFSIQRCKYNLWQTSLKYILHKTIEIDKHVVVKVNLRQIYFSWSLKTIHLLRR